MHTEAPKVVVVQSTFRYLCEKSLSAAASGLSRRAVTLPLAVVPFACSCSTMELL